VTGSARFVVTRGATISTAPDSGHHLPRLRVAVTDHQSPALLIPLVGERDPHDSRVAYLVFAAAS